MIYLWALKRQDYTNLRVHIVAAIFLYTKPPAVRDQSRHPGDFTKQTPIRR
jgi:hypothetical protein